MMKSDCRKSKYVQVFEGKEERGLEPRRILSIYRKCWKKSSNLQVKGLPGTAKFQVRELKGSLSGRRLKNRDIFTQ